jgi:O-succinylbenzoic acid--CoA ligase
MSKRQTTFIYQSQKFSIQDILSMSFDADQYNQLFLKTVAFVRSWFDDFSIIQQQTSGSTGKPKLINIEKKKMTASAKSTVETLNLPKGSSAFLNLNTDYIGGKMMVVRAIINQMELYIGDITSNPLKDLQVSSQIDFFSFVPYQLSQILSDTPENAQLINQSKAIILGGAPVSASLQSLIDQHLNCPVYSTYGMTETVSHIALKRLNANAPLNYFKALKGVHFSADENERLIIHAADIATKDPLVTNDVVKLIDQYTFDWLGRYDFVINSGGIKIHPEMVEKKISKVLTESSINFNFFIFPQEDEQLGEKVCLMVEGENDNFDWTPIFYELAKYEKPKAVFYLKDFARTASDKVDRLKSIRDWELGNRN